jgi:hypothetical protein
MALSAARLSIEIEIGTRCKITIEDTTDQKLEVTSELSEIQLQGIKDQFRADLETFRTSLASLSQRGLGNAAEALRQLQRRGRLTLNTLFGGQGDKLGRAIEMCQAACPDWEKPGWDESGLKPPVVVVRTKLGAGIPVELLPWLQLRQIDKVDSKDVLGQLAGSFLGFSAIVKRDIGVPVPDTLLLDNGPADQERPPRLPLKMFSYRMPGSREEERFFASRTDIDFGRSWPDKSAPGSDEQFAQSLAEHLWHPARGFSGTRREPPDQIFHFSCHCDTSDRLNGRHTLTLNAGGWWEELSGRGGRKVSLDALTDQLLLLRHSSQQAAGRRPLIFLNACGSAHINPAGAGSFSEMFLKNQFGYLGLIGTEATIPDHFASAFTKAFYEDVLQGEEIGEALYNARWKMLQAHNNPLGLLYTIYAEPEIRISHRPIDAHSGAGTGRT